MNREYYMREGANHCKVGRIIFASNPSGSWQRQAFIEGYNQQRLYMEGYALTLGLPYSDLMRFATLRQHPMSRAEVPEEILNFLDSVL